MRSVHIAVLPAALAITLSGCVTMSSAEIYDTARKATASEKALLIETARNTLFDPYSVRDAEIAEVVAISQGPDNRRLVCARFNAKNQVGGYTGRKTHLITLYADRVQSARIVNRSAEPCAKLKWYTFKEVERLRRI